MNRHNLCGEVGLTISFIKELERRAVNHGGHHKCRYFRIHLYESQEYRGVMGSTVMGMKQCNWKNGSEYIAPIFHTITKTYWNLQKLNESERKRERRRIKAEQTEQRSTTTEQPVEEETPTTSEDLHQENSKRTRIESIRITNYGRIEVNN